MTFLCFHLYGGVCHKKSVYEAMAAGLAIVTTENAGSLIVNGESGILIEPGNVIVRGFFDDANVVSRSKVQFGKKCRKKS